MINKSDMAISLAGVAFTDELHNSLGAAALSLRDTGEDSGHDFFRSLSINTAPGGAGVALVETVDFTVLEESVTETTSTGEKLGLTDRVSEFLGVAVHVYHKVQIINAIYQAIDLYFSGFYHGDIPSAARLNKEKNRYYEADADDTIDSTFGCGTVFCNAGATGIKLTLDFEKGQCVRFKKTDLYSTNKSAITLVMGDQVDNFTAIGGNYYLFLFKKDQWVDVYFDGTYYHTMGGGTDLSTGNRGTNDWTNRHLGDLVIVYNNQTVAFSVGEKITLASGVTGVIVWLNATTMIIKHATGIGNAVNLESITGSWGGDADVNGSTKNADSLIYHGMGIDQNEFISELYAYENATFAMATATRIGRICHSNATDVYTWNYEQMGIDTNNYNNQTGTSGVLKIGTNGVVTGYDNEDYSYYGSCKKNF